jgi:hypothetical protein
MTPLHKLLTVTGAQWRALHRRAVASARGRILDLDAERMAATDDLVALTVPALARLAVFALLAEGSEEPSPGCGNVLSRNAADVLRLLDCALAADGRDHDYPAAVWLEHAFCAAHTQAVAITMLGINEMPLSTMVEASAETVADVVIALRRDPLGVPEGLSDALGSLLVLYAAGIGMAA